MYLNDRYRSGRRIPVRVAPDNGRHISLQPQPVETVAPAAVPTRDEIERPPATETDWQKLALSLRAELDNFQRRQVRRANDAIAAERERLLRQFLPVVDNLNRALTAPNQNETTLKQGVELVYRQMTNLLREEAVKPIPTEGQTFNPELHEAVAVADIEAEAGIIVEEVERGYKLGDKLLRPARVVVSA